MPEALLISAYTFSNILAAYRALWKIAKFEHGCEDTQESAPATAASKPISASGRRRAPVWSTQYASFDMINHTLGSSSTRFAL